MTAAYRVVGGVLLVVLGTLGEPLLSRARPAWAQCNTTTTTSTSTSTIPNCCGYTKLRFSVGTGTGNCGTIVQANGAPIAGPNRNLACGNIYIGDGTSALPGNPAPPATSGSESGRTLTAVTSCNPVSGLVVYGPLTSGQTGDIENCSASGCLFGAPLPIPNPASTPTSTCILNAIGAAGITALGNCFTGHALASVPLISNVYLTGDQLPAVSGIQPCPLCTGGTCHGGARDGLGCTPDSGVPGSAAQYPTSHDCPPNGLDFLNAITVPFSLTTGTKTQTATNTDGSGGQQRVFCGLCRDANTTNGFGVCTGGSNAGNPCQFSTDCPGGSCGNTVACTSNAGCPTDLCDDGVTPCHNDNDCMIAGATSCSTDTGKRELCQQRSNGAFGQTTSNTISLTGSPAGNVSDGLAHAATLVGTFCVDPTYDGSVDGAGGLPGPAAASLPGTAQLLP